MENKTAQHFVLQLGSLISLYLSLGFLLALLFGVINILFPDAAAGIWESDSARSTIRIGISMIIVFFPTYLILTRTVNRLRRKENNNSYLSLTKWLIYLSLLVGGGALLIDLVVVFMTFLEGEITIRFILKALAVIVVVGFAFYYYLLDARGYWLKNEKLSLYFASGVTLIVCASLAAGIMNIEAPAEVREMKLDNQMVGNLQDMQWRIEESFRVNEKLPENLETLYGAFPVPTAPENRPDYKYEVTGEKSYKLCATFAHDISGLNDPYARPIYEKNSDWIYKAGEWCFDRVIDDSYRQ